MPVYNLNNQIYDIPDSVVADFEKDNPTATISYKNGEDIYDIPVSEKNGFLKQFPNAVAYTEDSDGETKKVGDVIVGGTGTQEEADAIFEENARRFREMQAPIQAVSPSNEIDRLKSIRDTAQKEIDASSFTDRFFNDDTKAAVAARNAAEEALETYEEAQHADKGWFDRNVMGVIRGIGDKIGDLSTWDFGASGVSSAVALNDAYKKWENGEQLSPSEQNMLDAYGLAAAVQAEYQDKVGMAYKVGGSLPESASFGLSLALNPAAGVGKKVAEKAAKAAVKKYGTTLVSKLAKGAARVGGDVAEMAVATAIPGAGRVAEDYYNRLNGQSTFDVDDNGIVRYGGQVAQEDADKAIWKAFGSQFIENYSESMGNYFAPMGNMLSNLTAKGLKAANLGKVAEAITDISSSQFSKGIQRFKDAVKFDGFVGEYLEEVAGNFMNAATVGDMNFNSPDDPRSVFNPETNIETALSCALLSGTMYAVEAPVAAYNKYVPKRKLRNADNKAQELLGGRWADLKEMLDTASPQHLTQLVIGVHNATDLTFEQKNAVKDYVTRLVEYQAYNARMIQNANESTKETAEANKAYEEGASNDTPQFVFKANRMRNQAADALKKADESVYNGVTNAIANGQSIDAVLNGLDESVANLAKDYYNKEMRMRGVLDGVMDRAEDAIEEETRIIRDVTNKQTGLYTEINRVVVDENGEQVEQPGYVVGWISEGESRSPIFLPEGVENKEENRIPLKPTDYNPESLMEMPMDDVINSMAEIIRDQAQAGLSEKSKYAPEVLNAQMVQGQPIDTPSEQIIPISPMPEGNGWVVEVYAKDTNNKVAAKPEVREITTDEFRDILQAQLDAEEATIKAEQAVVEEQQQVAPQAEEIVAEQPTIATEEAAQPVVEEAKPQAPVIPTKQDGSIDFVAYGKEGSIKELGNQYGEKMPHKVAVTAKAFADDVVKAKENLDKANEALDNAPIGREQKAKEAQIKAQQAYEAVKNEADFWAEMDADIKAAQAEREAMLNPQVEVDMSEQPMTADEFVAQQLANGNITLTSESYKKETGFGEKERKKFPKMFRKAENGGMSIERAGERLMEIAAEEGLAFFDQEDANAGRDALINFLGSVYSWGDITGYVRNNREAMAKKELEDVRDEMESFIWNAFHMTPEEYATQREIEAVENPYENVDLAAIDAIFAEKEFESQTLNQETNESGRIAEGNQGESGILSEEQVGDNGGNQPSEKERSAEGTGNGTQDESETAQEPELTQEEGESVLEFAARVAEEQRRKPLRARAREWSEALGVDVTIYESVDDIEDESVRQQVKNIHKRKKLAPGWVTDGKVYFLMSDMADMDEVDNTYIHEVVAHVGMEKLLGKERFAKLCDKVWEMMPQAAKDYFYNYPEVSNIKDETKRRRKAADEYIAHLAEKQNLTPEEKTIWDNIVKAFRELLDKALNGIIGKSKLTDKDIAELIRASYANLKSGAAESVVGEGERFNISEGVKPSLLDVVRTLYARGKEYASKIFQRSFFDVANTPQFMKDLGLVGDKFTIKYGVIARHFGKDGSHDLTEQDWSKLPEALQNPFAISKLKDKDGSFRVYTTLLTERGEYVVVGADVKNAGRNIEVNAISTVFGRRNNANLPQNEEVIYKSKKITPEQASLLEQPNSAQYPSAQENISSDNKDNTSKSEKQGKSHSFRVIEDKNGRKSLVGLHNISESKLKKAIKQGGLANPSMAVIDLDEQSHVDYGDITLIAPSSLIDKKSGKNIGTYTADAWTPIYPNIEKRMSDKGAEIYSKSLESIPSELRNKVRLYFNAYLEDGNTSGALNYWFLHDTGKNPPSLTSQSNDYTNEELDAIEAISNAGYYSGLNEEEKQKVLDLFIEKQGGKDAFDAKIAERIETMKNNLQRPDLKAFMKNKVEQKLQEIQEYGYDYEQVSNFYSNAQRAINNRGKIDEFRTFRNAQDTVNNEGLQGEFNEWLADKEEQFGVEEYLFVGYNNNGDRKYLPNTLENASKLMKKEGRAGATGLHGFNHFIATLAPNVGSLAQINKKKGNLSTQEEYDAFREKWGDVYHELAKQLQPDAIGYADYGYYRLEEMPTVKNPKEYVKKEYGIELSDEFMKKYNEFVSAIKNDFPARYFETKFERPVYLNEFAAAVVPQGTSKDVVDALTEAGLPVEEYESGNNEARMEAVDKVSSEIEGVRFRFIGEKGAANLDKARQLQAEVDKFTSKYNSKPVVVIDSNMPDKELKRLVGFEAKEVRDAIELGLNSGYNPDTDKIYIMTDNVKDSSDLEDSLFHENLHQYLLSDKSLVVEFFADAEDAYKKNIEQIKKEGYKAYEVPEELFVRVVADSQVKGNFAKVFSFLSEEGKEKLTNLLKENGYDIARETEIRTSGRMDGSGRDGSGRRNGDDFRRVAKESSSVASPSKMEKNGRAAEIRQLFDQVADNGLRGVVGDKAYNTAMFEMYRSLPMEARERVAMDALNNHGADMGKAMDKFIGESYDTSLWDIVVGAIRNMLRKKGYDIRFSENDIRYLVWRNRQKLNRDSILDVAEDIDTRYRLKVGEYEDSPTDGGDTPDGGGTRFKVKDGEKTVQNLRDHVASLKEEVANLKKEVRDLRKGSKEEWETKQRAIISFVKGRLTKEAGEELGKTRIEQILTLVTKASNSNDLHKPLQFIEQVINSAIIDSAAARMDKLIKTRLQGETSRGVAKGVVVDEATRRLFDSIRGTFKDLIATSIDSELRHVRGEILRFGKEIKALPEDDTMNRNTLQKQQDALKERRKQLEEEQEELRKKNITETKEWITKRHDELVEAMDAHIEGNGVWTQEMQDEYDSLPLREKLAEIRESQNQMDAILADALRARREAYMNTGEARKRLLAEADMIESNYSIAQEELIKLMNEVSNELSEIIKGGKERLASRKQMLAERRRMIVGMGIDAVKKRKVHSPNDILSKEEKFHKWFDNSWLKKVSDFMTAPLNSFNFMLKYVDNNHTIGEGELYKHFMKSKEGALEANNRLYDGLKAYNTTIEEKVKEIFGKDIESVMKDSGKKHEGAVHKQYMYDSASHRGGEMYPISISKGEALYVWLTWRQPDGYAKLIYDGWNEQSIAEIEDLIGKEYMEFGEWITEDFFPQLREEKYNKTHIEMFGTSMAKREHYFPFKVYGEDIQEKGEMGESYSGMPSTVTGNIIKRTINKSRIDTEKNAFDMIYKYGNDMETWNAMAKLRQDLNFLHSSKAFRNYLEANSKGLFDKFIKSAEVAVKAYNNSGESNAINDFLVKFNRMWAGSNIGFRLNTAMKQILSYPAFAAYSGKVKYQANLAKYMLNWKGNYEWAKENLPAFRNRIETGDMGMTGMSDPQFDFAKYIKKFTDAGMIPNQLVDALTCAAGARSVYDFEYEQAIKAGLSENEAENVARYNAEIAFNETQQSSRDEFVSPIQISRNVLIKSMMNYQNSNVGYQRMGNEGLLEIMRAKQVYKEDIKNGMSEADAKKKMANSIARGVRKVVVTFAVLPGLWYLGGRGIVGITAPLISSLFGGGGDDEPYLDDEAKEELLLSIALGTVAGTSGGQLIAGLAQGREYNPMAWMNEMQKDIVGAVKNGWNMNTTKNIALRLTKFGGVNIETFENIYLGVEHAIRTGNFDLVDFMMLINLPASQRKAIAEELYSDMPFMEYAEKVSRAQKLFDDYRKHLPYAKSDKTGSKKNAIKKQYIIENMDDSKQEELEKEKEFKKLKRDYNSAEDRKEWLEEHPEYKELEKEYADQTITKEVNNKAKRLK